MVEHPLRDVVDGIGCDEDSEEHQKATHRLFDEGQVLSEPRHPLHEGADQKGRQNKRGGHSNPVDE